MSVDRSIFKKAAEYLKTNGWRNDGEYADNNSDEVPVGPCCLLGACAAVLSLSPEDFVLEHPAYYKVQEAVNARGFSGRSFGSVVDWNDQQADAAPVIALLEELAEGSAG